MSNKHKICRWSLSVEEEHICKCHYSENDNETLEDDSLCDECQEYYYDSLDSADYKEDIQDEVLL